MEPDEGGTVNVQVNQDPAEPEPVGDGAGDDPTDAAELGALNRLSEIVGRLEGLYEGLTERVDSVETNVLARLDDIGPYAPLDHEHPEYVRRDEELTGGGDTITIAPPMEPEPLQQDSPEGEPEPGEAPPGQPEIVDVDVDEDQRGRVRLRVFG